MRTLKIVLAFSLLFFATFSTVASVNAQPPIEDVVVPVLENPVNLDGAIGVDEWSDAVELAVTFRFYNETSGQYVENRTGSIYLKHDCVDLWVGVEMEDPTNDSQSWLAVFYDVNDDGFVPGTGDDEKGLLHPDTAWDVAITGPMTWDNDTDIGGSLDNQGASGWSAGGLTYELVHPLNSGDTIGNDLSLYPGDEILSVFMVGDPEVDPMLYGFAFTEEWAYEFNLVTTPCPVGGEILPINLLELMAPYLLAIAAVAATALALLKRKPL